MHRGKENGKKKGLSLKGTVPKVLTIIMVMSLFIFAPKDVGAFYLPTGDSGEAGRINSTSPLGESGFKAPVLAAEEKKTEASGLTSLTPEEVATYNRYQKVYEQDGKLYWPDSRRGQEGGIGLMMLTPLSESEIATYNQYKQVINIGGQLYWEKENKDSQNEKPTTPVVKNPLPISPHKPKPNTEESQEPKQVPPGIEKQGDKKHEDEGNHFGWVKGNHKGWEKKPDSDRTAKLKELELNLVGKALKAKGQTEINPEDKARNERPKLKINNLPNPLNQDKDADSLGIPRQINELKLENGQSYKTGQMQGPNDQIRIKSLPIQVR